MPENFPLPDPKDCLPHGDAFRFVDRIETLDRGKSIVAIWEVPADAPFLEAHFPGNPIVPGVLVSEALAQAAGLAARAGDTPQPGAIAHLDLRFKQPIIPPAAIILHATVKQEVGPLVFFDVKACVGEQVCLNGRIALALP